MKKTVSSILILVLLIMNFTLILPTTAVFADDELPLQDGYDYLQIGEDDSFQTIQSHLLLADLLTYNGNPRNVHMAKWVASDPVNIDYPAYCVSPGKLGVAQHSDKNYKVKPRENLTTIDHKVMGIMRAGYPYKSPEELGVPGPTDAYYATQAAIFHYLMHGDDEAALDRWGFTGTPSVTQNILTAMKNIYNEGRNNPYYPPEIILDFKPLEKLNDGKAVEEGDWAVNSYTLESNYTFTHYCLKLFDQNAYDLINQGQMKVTDTAGNVLTPQTGVLGNWDTELGFKIPNGTDIKIWYDIEYAKSQGAEINLGMRATICDVTREYSAIYIGDPEDPENWQGYMYSFIPQQGDISVFKFPHEPITTPSPTPPPSEPPTTPTPTPPSDGNLRIRKIDSTDSRKGLDGVVLRVRSITNSYDQTFTTSGGGYITMSDLAPGDYFISEVATIPGYVLSGEIVPVTVRYGETATATFKNEPDGTTTVIKVDAITGKHLQGANIMVTNPTTGQTWDLLTGADGTATVKLPPGEYTVQEKNAPVGYELSSCPQTVVVLPGENSSVKIQNYPFGTMLITKIDAKTGLAMAGVSLRIYNYTLNYDKTEVTDSKGQIHLTDLKPGDYTITEVATIPGYELSTEVLTRTVAYGQETTVTFTNEPKGSATVIKVDSITGEHLANANIKLTNPATGQTWDLLTGADGTATVENLSPGEYYFQEQNAPLGYELNCQTFPVTVVSGENSSVKIQNNPLGTMLITKIDAKTGLPMAGVKLRIYNDTLNFDRTETTDVKGQIHLTDLYPGDYTITEVSTIPGYELSTEVLTRTVAYGQETTVTFTNEPKGSATVIKVDSITGEHLQGANIKLTDPKTGQTWDLLTGADGTATVENLSPGEYYFQEQNPPLHYELNSQTFPVTVVSGENSSVKIQNNPLGKLEITKISSVDPSKTLAGVKLRVQNTSLGIDNIYTTDISGKILIEDLKPADYAISEVATIPGYVLSDEVVIATVNYGKTTYAVFKNQPKPGLTILKRDKDTLKPLSGAVFTVEKIGEPQNGAITGNPFTTDSSGKVFIPDLLPGSYKITEIQAPHGYNLSDPNFQIITMREGEDNTVTFENTRQPLFTLTKTDSKTGKPIEGAAFSIEKIDNPGKGMVTGIPLFTGEDGKIIISDLLSGVYRVTEVEPANGYGMPSPNVWEINIKANENYNLKVKNTRLPSLVINKIDGWSYKGIPNTYFEIFYAVNGSMYGDYRSLGTYKTDVNGQIIIPNCQPGWYKYVETRPAPGYSKPSNPTKEVFLKLGDNAYSGVGGDAWETENGMIITGMVQIMGVQKQATGELQQSTQPTAVQTTVFTSEPNQDNTATLSTETEPNQVESTPIPPVSSESSLTPTQPNIAKLEATLPNENR